MQQQLQTYQITTLGGRQFSDKIFHHNNSLRNIILTLKQIYQNVTEVISRNSYSQHEDQSTTLGQIKLLQQIVGNTQKRLKTTKQMNVSLQIQLYDILKRVALIEQGNQKLIHKLKDDITRSTIIDKLNALFNPQFQKDRQLYHQKLPRLLQIFIETIKSFRVVLYQVLYESHVTLDEQFEKMEFEIQMLSRKIAQLQAQNKVFLDKQAFNKGQLSKLSKLVRRICQNSTLQTIKDLQEQLLLQRNKYSSQSVDSSSKKSCQQSNKEDKQSDQQNQQNEKLSNPLSDKQHSRQSDSQNNKQQSQQLLRRNSIQQQDQYQNHKQSEKSEYSEDYYQIFAVFLQQFKVSLTNLYNLKRKINQNHTILSSLDKILQMNTKDQEKIELFQENRKLNQTIIQLQEENIKQRRRQDHEVRKLTELFRIIKGSSQMYSQKQLTLNSNTINYQKQNTQQPNGIIITGDFQRVQQQINNLKHQLLSLKKQLANTKQINITYKSLLNQNSNQKSNLPEIIMGMIDCNVSDLLNCLDYQSQVQKSQKSSISQNQNIKKLSNSKTNPLQQKQNQNPFI